MDNAEALAIVKQQMPEKRYKHTLRVTETARKLAKLFSVDIKKAELAAIFHDYAKHRPKEEMRQLILTSDLPKDLLDYHSELWHAPVGAMLVNEEVGIEDHDILQAIRSHTTGRPSMSPLEKIIFLADYSEPHRQFPGVEQVRILSMKDLNAAMLVAISQMIHYLVEKQVLVYPNTLLTYNDLIHKVKNNNH